ncbi:hypothetical protein A4X13_0g8734, partial [Tilletia indica]
MPHSRTQRYKSLTVQGNDGTRDRVSRREARPARPQRRLNRLSKTEDDSVVTSRRRPSAVALRRGIKNGKKNADQPQGQGPDLIRNRADIDSDGKAKDTGRLGVRQERTMTARGVKARSPLTGAARATVGDTHGDGADSQQDEGTTRSRRRAHGKRRQGQGRQQLGKPEQVGDMA